MHVKVDALVELPAIAGVLITALLLWLLWPVSNHGFVAMALAGLLAIGANLICVYLVFARRQAAVAADWARFDALDKRQHQLGAVVLIAAVTAMGAGIVGRGVG